MYFDKKKLYIRSAFSFALAHYHCFSCIRGKSQIFLQSIGQSNLFTLYISFDDLTFNTCGYFARPISVWKKTYAYVKPLSEGFIILLFFHLLTIWRLDFERHPAALSERSVRILFLFRCVWPTHIFRVCFPMRYNGVIVALCQILLAWSFSRKYTQIYKKKKRFKVNCRHLALW